MDPIKEKSPASLTSDRARVIQRGALLSINKITQSLAQVKTQTGGGYENLS